MTVSILVKQDDQTSDHEASGPEHVSSNTRSRVTMAFPTSLPSPYSESFDSDMDMLTLSMGRNALTDETTPPSIDPIDPRVKLNGRYSCQGLTVEGKLCDRDGIDEVPLKEGIGFYCFQHNPEKSHQRCLAYNKGGKRCANTCSISAGEVREDGRPICNTHHKWGAKLIDKSHYPGHHCLNKKK